MRHRIAGKQLNLDTDHRRAMLRNLAAGLFEHGQIETTLPKAKAVQPFVEKIITIAKQGTFRARRQIERKINDRMIHVWVADPSVKDWKKDNPFFDLPDASEIEFNRYGETRKAPRLVQHIMTKVAPMFADRDGGYTRIVKLGKRRLGDATPLVLLQLVGKEDGPQLGGGTSRRRQQADKRTAFAAQRRKGTSSDATAAPAAAQTETATATAEAQTDAPAAENAAAEEKSE